METSNAVAALSALAQDNRLEIFRLLVQAGPEGMAAGQENVLRLDVAVHGVSCAPTERRPAKSLRKREHVS